MKQVAIRGGLTNLKMMERRAAELYQLYIQGPCGVDLTVNNHLISSVYGVIDQNISISVVVDEGPIRELHIYKELR
jgi:hypothetical protein